MMKNIIIVAFCLCVGGVMSSCQDETIGFLITKYASYKIDSLVIKEKLDVTPPVLVEVSNPEYERNIADGYTPEELEEMGIYPTVKKEIVGEDYWRDKLGQPWVSTPIEGLEGTAPIYVSIKRVHSTDGDAEKMKVNLSVRGDGTFEVPVHHNVPVGHYVISLNFRNEGYSRDVNDCFTIIVK